MIHSKQQIRLYMQFQNLYVILPAFYLSVIFTSNEYDGIISDQDAEVLEHRFFGRDEIPEELFPADSRAILDWKNGIDEVVVH